MKHHFENHDLVTERSSQLIDVTDELHAAVGRAEVENGMALVYSPHTTCAIVINEHESGFIDDFNELLAELAPENGRYYRHDDLAIRTEGLDVDDLAIRTEGLDDDDLHDRDRLRRGREDAGRWQRVFFCELDRSRPRKIFIQVIGE